MVRGVGGEEGPWRGRRLGGGEGDVGGGGEVGEGQVRRMLRAAIGSIGI